MRKIITIALVVVLGLCLAATAFADKATKQEVIAKVKEAAKMIANEGQDAAFAEINNKKGKFVWKDTYVFATNCKKGEIAAHPNPKLIGMSSAVVKCKKTDRLILKEACDKVSSKGLWMEYWWPKPGAEGIFRKVVFLIPVEGTPYQVAAGIYDDNLSLEELRKDLE